MHRNIVKVLKNDLLHLHCEGNERVSSKNGEGERGEKGGEKEGERGGESKEETHSDDDSSATRPILSVKMERSQRQYTRIVQTSRRLGLAAARTHDGGGGGGGERRKGGDGEKVVALLIPAAMQAGRELASARCVRVVDTYRLPYPVSAIVCDRQDTPWDMVMRKAEGKEEGEGGIIGVGSVKGRITLSPLLLFSSFSDKYSRKLAVPLPPSPSAHALTTANAAFGVGEAAGKVLSVRMSECSCEVIRVEEVGRDGSSEEEKKEGKAMPFLLHPSATMSIVSAFLIYSHRHCAVCALTSHPTSREGGEEGEKGDLSYLRSQLGEVAKEAMKGTVIIPQQNMVPVWMVCAVSHTHAGTPALATAAAATTSTTSNSSSVSSNDNGRGSDQVCANRSEDGETALLVQPLLLREVPLSTVIAVSPSTAMKVVLDIITSKVKE
uniref:Uncharacterized protein n=1 Tax=Palpitomonas bilix TaxID=652834 RepID=A0A7S3DIJ3_9EUKA